MDLLITLGAISILAFAFSVYFLFIKIETYETKKEHILNAGFFQKKITVKSKHFFKRGKEVHPPIVVEEKTHVKMNPKFALELIPYSSLFAGSGKVLIKKF